MNAILSVFVLGAVGWWCLTILFVIYGFFALDRDYEDKTLFWPIAMLIVYVLFMQFIAKANIFSFAVEHPWKLVLYILGYFVLGFVWSFVKWWLFVNTAAEKYNEKRAEFLKEYSPRWSAVPDDIRSPSRERNKQSEWESYVTRNKLSKPMASKHKGKITVWVMYWPVSLVWSLLDDFIKKMIRQIITMFQKFYQFISDQAFKKFESDITK
jgi:hypothetical protein